MITAIPHVTSTLTKVEIAKSLNCLKEIIFENYQCNDLLSLRIKDWSRYTLKIIPTISDLSPNKLINHIEEAVSKLFKEVLLTSLFTQVTNPICDGKHTWNLEEYEVYQKIYPNSPFDGLPLNSAFVHTFALKILEWGKKHSFQEQSKQIIPSHCISPINSLAKVSSENGVINYQEAEKQLKVFISIGKIAETQLVNYTLSQTLRDMAEESKIATQEIEKFVELESAREKRVDEIQKQMIRTKIDWIKQSHEATGKIKGTRISHHEQDLEITKKQLAYMEQKNASQEGRIIELEKNIKAL